MLQSGTCGHPLDVPVAISARRAVGIGMVDKSVQDHGDGFEPPVWMGGESGYF